MYSDLKNNLQIYGRYSLGSGNVLSNPDVLFNKINNRVAIDSYKRYIISDLNKAGIALENLKNYAVMDAGTGRQAIVFHELGAKEVKHYDLSPENVARMKAFIKQKSLQNKITTECVDLVNFAPPKYYFDFIFLHGITPCFSNVEKGLINCMNSVKENGIVSLYFYRSGTFQKFAVYLIRDLIDSYFFHKEYFLSACLLFSENCIPNHFISNVMDAFFTPHVHLFSAKSYISFVNACGFEIISSSKLDPINKNIDHGYAQPAVVINCQRTTLKDLENLSFGILTPDKKIDQLDPANYSPLDSEIIKTINEYNKLKNALTKNKVAGSIIIALTLKIYSYLQNVEDIDENLNNHKFLRIILRNAKKLIKEEFGAE